MADTYPLVPNRITRIEPQFKTSIVKFEGPYEQRAANWNDAKVTFVLHHEGLTKAEYETLKAHFEDRKGSFKRFYFPNYLDELVYPVRFKEDRLPVMPINAQFFDIDVEVIFCP